MSDEPIEAVKQRAKAEIDAFIAQQLRAIVCLGFNVLILLPIVASSANYGESSLSFISILLANGLTWMVVNLRTSTVHTWWDVVYAFAVGAIMTVFSGTTGRVITAVGGVDGELKGDVIRLWMRDHPEPFFDSSALDRLKP